MLGKIPEMMKLLSDKNALAQKIKGEVPGLIDQLVTVIGAQCGATDAEPFGVVLFKANTAQGPTTMARVHRANAFGELGEELGCIDIKAAMQSIPNDVITNMLPF